MADHGDGYAAQHAALMTARRRALYELLGDLPPRDRPVQFEIQDVEERETYVVETLRLDLNGLEAVPAYFVRPRGSAGPFPTVHYHHSHGGNYSLGKDEFLQSRDYMYSVPWAEDLARNGWAGLCIDHWCFGERRGRTESMTFKDFLWHGRVLWGMMVFDTLKATDYLVSRQDVDPQRLAGVGMSMGSTMAWWHAALDDRVTAIVDICCLTDFQALIEDGGLERHGLYYYVPGLLKQFTTANINTLVCPRAHLALAGERDSLTPTAGLDRVDASLKQAYEEAGVPERWQLIRYPVGHQETAEMRRDALAWLDQWARRCQPPLSP